MRDLFRGGGGAEGIRKVIERGTSRREWKEYLKRLYINMQ